MRGWKKRSTNRWIFAILGQKRSRRRSGSVIRILFVCHGNICRSPMAEFVMKDLVKKAGLTSRFQIASAATSREEIGNPVYPLKTPQAGRAWDLLRRPRSPTVDPGRLRGIRSSDWHGPGERPQHPADLRRRPGGKSPSPAGVRRPSRPGSGRSLVYWRLRGYLAGCTGGVPGTM